MKQNHVRLKTHLFQIPPWPKGYNFQLISLLSWFLKPVWLLCFPSRRDQLHVPSPCQQPRGYSWDIPMCTPRRGYSIRKRWSSLTWRKTHFLPMFTSTWEKNIFSPWPLDPQTSVALPIHFAALSPPEQTAGAPGASWPHLDWGWPAPAHARAYARSKGKPCKCFPIRLDAGINLKIGCISTPRLSQLMGRKFFAEKPLLYTRRSGPRRRCFPTRINNVHTIQPVFIPGGLFSAPWRCPRNPFYLFRQAPWLRNIRFLIKK